MTKVTVVFPSDYFKLSEVDPHFADELVEAQNRGFNVVFYNHDKIVMGVNTKALFIQNKQEADSVILRGWMLTPEQYSFLFQSLKDKDIVLDVTPEQYQRSHHLPGWYETISQFTAPTVYTEGDNVEELLVRAQSLPSGKGMLKDYVKSVKHIPEALLVEDVHSLDSLKSTVNVFKQHSVVQGGLVLRSWRNFTGPEWRTWWINGECKLFTAHPDTAEEFPTHKPDVSLVASQIQKLQVPFLTVDWCLTDQGWEIVEIGNGSVSDRPRSIEAKEFFASLF